MNYDNDNSEIRSMNGWDEAFYREEKLSDKNFSVRSIYYKKHELLEMELFYDGKQSIGKVGIYELDISEFNKRIKPKLSEIFSKEISIFKGSK